MKSFGSGSSFCYYFINVNKFNIKSKYYVILNFLKTFTKAAQNNLHAFKISHASKNTCQFNRFGIIIWIWTA